MSKPMGIFERKRLIAKIDKEIEEKQKYFAAIEKKLEKSTRELEVQALVEQAEEMRKQTTEMIRQTREMIKQTKWILITLFITAAGILVDIIIRILKW